MSAKPDDAFHARPVPQKGAATAHSRFRRPGKARNWILLWALGIPIPLLLIIFVLRGCT